VLWRPRRSCGMRSRMLQVAVAAAQIILVRDTAAQQARLTISPRQPSGGSLVRLTLERANRNGDSVVAVRGTMAGEPLHFRATVGGLMQALGAIPVTPSDSVVARVEIERRSGVTDTARLVLKYPHQPAPVVAATATRSATSRRLTVDKVFTQRMDSATNARIEHENEMAREIGRHAQSTPQLWTLPFSRPRDSRVTSRFGSGRLFNGRVSSNHLGVDYRGALGDPIYAANRGVVALVSNFFLAGNVVYIDHGNGLVTAYFHMSKQEVAAGDTVERGQEIGLVGATGRVTGPHLHWSARFGTLTIDPGDLLGLGAPWVAPEIRTPALRRVRKPLR